MSDHAYPGYWQQRICSPVRHSIGPIGELIARFRGRVVGDKQITCIARWPLPCVSHRESLPQGWRSGDSAGAAGRTIKNCCGRRTRGSNRRRTVRRLVRNSLSACTPPTVIGSAARACQAGSRSRRRIQRHNADSEMLDELVLFRPSTPSAIPIGPLRLTTLAATPPRFRIDTALVRHLTGSRTGARRRCCPRNRASHSYFGRCTPRSTPC